MFTTRSTLRATIAVPCLLRLAAACGAAVERSGFEAEVTGAVETAMRGTSAYTPNALTLSAGDSTAEGVTGGTLVFATSDGAGLATGSYVVSSKGKGKTPFVNALFIAGAPSRPIGVFHGSAGALTVTTATEQRIAGRFELEAVSVLAGGDSTRRKHRGHSGDTDSAAVRVSGSFLVLDPCSAVTSQAAAPCVRPAVRLRSSRFEPSNRFFTLDERK